MSFRAENVNCSKTEPDAPAELRFAYDEVS
mgnify:FL=1